MNYDRSPFSLTPWVRRMLAAMGAVYLLQLTVFTSPWLVETFGFSPVDALRHPWGFLTYALLHGSFLHLLLNAVALFMFGPPVEARLGGPRFAALLAVSVAGGSLLSLAMLPLTGDVNVIGASAAVFGVMLAFVLEWPDAPVLIFPLPVPVKAKWLVAFLAAMSLVLGIYGAQDHVAHFAHLGGFAAAFLYLRGGRLRRRRPAGPSFERTPAVLVRPTAGETGRRFSPPHETLPPRPSDDAVRNEVNRVLDKISAGGLESLTPEERRFLDEMSKRFRQTH